MLYSSPHFGAAFVSNDLEESASMSAGLGVGSLGLEPLDELLDSELLGKSVTASASARRWSGRCSGVRLWLARRCSSRCGRLRRSRSWLARCSGRARSGGSVGGSRCGGSCSAAVGATAATEQCWAWNVILDVLDIGIEYDSVFSRSIQRLAGSSSGAFSARSGDFNVEALRVVLRAALCLC